ncbi:MAG: helix-turn-helix domain-containing protein [Arcanobacterium sp.]
MQTVKTNQLEPAYTTIKGAAEHLEVHPDTIRRMIYAQKLPHVRIGRAIRIPLSALSVDALKEIQA